MLLNILNQRTVPKASEIADLHFATHHWIVIYNTNTSCKQISHKRKTPKKILLPFTKMSVKFTILKKEGWNLVYVYLERFPKNESLQSFSKSSLGASRRLGSCWTCWSFKLPLYQIIANSRALNLSSFFGFFTLLSLLISSYFDDSFRRASPYSSASQMKSIATKMLWGFIFVPRTSKIFFLKIWGCL